MATVSPTSSEYSRRHFSITKRSLVRKWSCMRGNGLSGVISLEKTLHCAYFPHGIRESAREVHQTGEGHVPSMRNCSEVCCRNKRTLCRRSWSPPRIRFQPFRLCHHDGFPDGKHQTKTLWQMMFTDDVVLCAREKDVLELEMKQ